MRDAQTQGVTEERGHGEPVGQTTHDRRFRRGPDQRSQIRRFGIEARTDEDGDRNDQQGRGTALGAAQLGAFVRGIAENRRWRTKRRQLSIGGHDGARPAMGYLPLVLGLDWRLASCRSRTAANSS